MSTLYKSVYLKRIHQGIKKKIVCINGERCHVLTPYGLKNIHLCVMDNPYSEKRERNRRCTRKNMWENSIKKKETLANYAFAHMVLQWCCMIGGHKWVTMHGVMWPPYHLGWAQIWWMWFSYTTKIYMPSILILF